MADGDCVGDDEEDELSADSLLFRSGFFATGLRFVLAGLASLLAFFC